MGGYLIYIALLIIIPLWAQAKVRSAYSKYLKSQLLPKEQVPRWQEKFWMITDYTM